MYGNTVSYYSGAKTLRFSGASTSLKGNVPQMDGVNFGNNTSISFSGGVATATMRLYKVETANIVATDWTSGGAGITTSGTDRLSVAVNIDTTTIQLKTNAGDSQSATVNTNVATAPQVIIEDNWGNPLASINVTFSVQAGGGSITGGSTSTNASGLATVGSWTLGTNASLAQTLRATTSLYGSVDFSATAVPASPNYVTLTYSSGGTSANNMVAGGDYYLTVTAFDVYNNQCTNFNQYADVIFGGADTSPGSSTGAGSATAESPRAFLNDNVSTQIFGGFNGRNFSSGAATYRLKLYAKGVAGITARLYTNYPTNTISVVQNASHTITVAQASIAYMVALSSTQQITTVNYSVSSVPSVRVVDAYGNRYQGAEVTFTTNDGTISPGHPTVVINTNSNGESSLSSWQIGTTSSTNGSTYNKYVLTTCAPASPNAIYFNVAGQPDRPEAYGSYPGGSITIEKIGGGNATAGVPFDVRVTYKDAFGNVCAWGDNAYAYDYFDSNPTRSVVNTYRSTVFYGNANEAPIGGYYPEAQGSTGIWVRFQGYPGSGFNGTDYAAGTVVYSMRLYRAETATVSVAQGWVGSSPAGLTNSISITVVPTTTSTAQSSISINNSIAVEGSTATVTLSPRDAYGNSQTNSQTSVSLLSSFGTLGSFSGTTGTYTATYTFPEITSALVDVNTSQRTVSAISATVGGNNITNSPISITSRDTQGATGYGNVCGGSIGLTPGTYYEIQANGSGFLQYVNGQENSTECCGDTGQYVCQGTCCPVIYECCSYGCNYSATPCDGGDGA